MLPLDFVSLKLKKLGGTGIDKIWTSILSLHHFLIPINSKPSSYVMKFFGPFIFITFSISPAPPSVLCFIKYFFPFISISIKFIESIASIIPSLLIPLPFSSKYIPMSSVIKMPKNISQNVLLFCFL